MGCGAATTDKDAIKPLQQVQNEIGDRNQEVENNKTEKTPLHESVKYSPKDKKIFVSSPAGTSNLRGSSTGKKHDKIKNSDVNIKTSDSRIKRSDSLQKSPSREKSLRESSPGKSQKHLNGKDTSKSSKKNMNPQTFGQAALLRQTDSVIKEQGAIKPMKVNQKTIKKVKSIRNNRQLSDLIKVYGL